jgi:hypothetical protein
MEHAVRAGQVASSVRACRAMASKRQSDPRAETASASRPSMAEADWAPRRTKSASNDQSGTPHLAILATPSGGALLPLAHQEHFTLELEAAPAPHLVLHQLNQGKDIPGRGAPRVDNDVAMEGGHLGAADPAPLQTE